MGYELGSTGRQVEKSDTLHSALGSICVMGDTFHPVDSVAFATLRRIELLK